MFKSILKVQLLYVFLITMLLSPATVFACGAFVPVPNSPFAAGTGSSGLAYSPVIDGRLFAAVTNQNSNNISLYSVDTTSGEFSQIGSSPFAAGFSPGDIAYSPLVNGNVFAAVTNPIGSSVVSYSVDTTTGDFNLVASYLTGSITLGAAYSPLINGNLFAAVANSGGSVSVYSVNTTTGAFTAVGGSPFAAGTSPADVAYSPVINGNVFAAVANQGSNDVSVYSVDTMNGVFTAVGGSPFAAGSFPQSIAYSPVINGNVFAGVPNSGDDTISVYSVDTATGALTQVAGSPFAAGNAPGIIAYSPVVNGNLFAAVTSGDGIFVYSVNPTTGALTPVVGSPFVAANEPSSVAYSPEVNGNLFAAASSFGGNNVSVYSVVTSCPPTPPVPPTPPTPQQKVVLCGSKCRVARSRRPRICGRAQPGTVVHLRANNKFVGKAKANCRGVFCITPCRPLATGCNTVVACIRDGNTIACSNALRVIVEQEADSKTRKPCNSTRSRIGIFCDLLVKQNLNARGTVRIDNLNGVLQANNGIISAGPLPVVNSGTPLNEPNTLVLRDGSGSFAATNINIENILAANFVQASSLDAASATIATNASVGIDINVAHNVITKNIDLPLISTTTEGSILKGNTPFIHNFGSTNNTSVGLEALNPTVSNTGTNNTAVGNQALRANTSGSTNTAVGQSSLINVQTGNNNTAVGSFSGVNHTLADSNNIDIGNGGVLGNSGAIRIGTNGTHTTAFVAGIANVAAAAGLNAVYYDRTTNQLFSLN